AGKRFNLVRDLLPQATTIAYLLGGPNLTSEALKSDILAAGRALGQQVVILETRGDRDDYEAVFETLVERQAEALMVASFPPFASNYDKILALAARHRIPAIYPNRGFVEAGGLMATPPFTPTSTVKPAFTPVGFSEGKSPRSCRSCGRLSSSSSSTSRPPRRSVSQSLGY